MEITKVIDRTKLKRERTKEAIDLALKGHWDKAADANREILSLFPNDVEALNRLGKALMELGRYDEARVAFDETLKHSPHNGIAKKNLERIAGYQTSGTRRDNVKRKGAARRFVEESGKSGVTVLIRTAEPDVLEKLSPSDAVEIEVRGQALIVRDTTGEYLGQVEPRLSARLSRLIEGGNRYEGAVVSVRGSRIAVLLEETYRHPSQANVASFLGRDSNEYRSVFQDTVVEYPLNDEAEIEALDTSMDWMTDDDDAVSPADNPPRGIRIQ
jgi:tetratricopeptide (TPR) repeat protein